MRVNLNNNWFFVKNENGKNDLFIYQLAVTRSILNGNIFENSVLALIFNFSVHTGSRFLVSNMSSHHYDQTRAYAVWISKIRLSVLKIWAKSLFPSKTEVDFQRQKNEVIIYNIEPTLRTLISLLVRISSPVWKNSTAYLVFCYMSLYQISSPVGWKEEFFAICLCISKSSLVGKNATVLISSLVNLLGSRE